jgi:alkanesulfonate monooxygenase SsuD/methylene tetrahydromethanopterin reductase-like flavin-dependent oxidoreductase (luciferase family)
VRMAEEIATLDQISHGRLNIGIGRSGFPWAYEGYNISYAESRERFREFFDVMKLAWTEERFSYQGHYYTFKDVCLIPKPYQKPHPPLRYASTTKESFAAMGRMGLPIFAGAGGVTVAELARSVGEYRTPWREAGHPGDGDVMLRIGIYVAEDQDRAISEPRESTMSFYGRVREGLLQTAGAFGGELRAQRAQNLASLTYESALRDRLVYGTPDAVAKRLKELRDELGLSGVLMEPNVGGLISPDRLERSIRLFGQEVAPQLGS